MTASTEAGVEEFNNEAAGRHSMAAEPVPTSNPPEPDQPGTPSTTGGVHPNDSGMPQVHVVTEGEA